MSASDNITDLEARIIKKKLSMNKQDWSEIDNIQLSIAEGLLAVGDSISLSVKTITAAGLINNQELTNLIKGITKDLKTFADDLMKIKSRHENCSGPINNEDMLALSLSVYTDYVNLNGMFQAIIFPSLQTLTEFTAEAIQVLKNKNIGESNDKPE